MSTTRRAWRAYHILLWTNRTFFCLCTAAAVINAGSGRPFEAFMALGSVAAMGFALAELMPRWRHTLQCWERQDAQLARTIANLDAVTAEWIVSRF